MMKDEWDKRRKMNEVLPSKVSAGVFVVRYFGMCVNIFASWIKDGKIPPTKERK
jgi:hypothetical protein